jgi:acyl-CoA synthetase (NDP forming)
VRLAARPPRGLRLGAMSNAGFECVAIADHLGQFVRAGFGEATRGRIGETLVAARLGGVVQVRNPFDSTPTLGDQGFVAVARAILEEPGVDAAVIGCVPHTGSIVTLPAGPGHDEDLTRAGGIVPGLVELWRTTDKPWLAVVDAGDRYDPMAAALEAAGVPVFRGADRALRLFGRWCVARLTRTGGAAAPVA